MRRARTRLFPARQIPIAQSALLQLISLPLTPPRHATPRHATPRHATPRPDTPTGRGGAAERARALPGGAEGGGAAEDALRRAGALPCSHHPADTPPRCSLPSAPRESPPRRHPGAPVRTAPHATKRLASSLCVCVCRCAEQNSVAKRGASERTAAEFALREARRMAAMTRQARRKRLAERRSHREDAVRCPPHPTRQPHYRQPTCSAASILSAVQARFPCTCRPSAHAASPLLPLTSPFARLSCRAPCADPCHRTHRHRRAGWSSSRSRRDSRSQT